MDEKFIQKYFDEFRKFSLMLEENEKRVVQLSEVNYDVDKNLHQKYDDASNMTYEDYIKGDNPYMSEDEFNKYKAERVSALQTNSFGTEIKDEYIPEINGKVEEDIDEITTKIQDEIAREKKIIGNLIKAVDANIKVIDDELKDCYQAMLAASTKEEKISYSVQFNDLKSSHDANLQALADMKKYRSLINAVEKEYSKTDLTYDSSILFADKLKEMETSIEYLGNKLDNVDYNEFVVDVVFDPTANNYKVNCRCGNVVLSPAPGFTEGQITPDTIDGILYKFADKVAANSPLTVEEIKNKKIDCKVNGNNIAKVPFSQAGEILCNNLNRDLNNGLGNQETVQTEITQEPPVPNATQSEITQEPTVQNPTQDPTQNGVTQEEIEPIQEPNGLDEGDFVEPTRESGVNEDIKELMKEAKRIKSVRKTRFHSAEIATIGTGALCAGLGFALGGPMIPIAVGLGALGAGIVGADVASRVIDNWKYNAVTHKYNRIARRLTRNLRKGDRHNGLKVYTKGNPTTGEVRFMISQDGREIGAIDSHSTGSVLVDGLGFGENEAYSIVDYLNDQLDKEFKYMNDDRKRKGSHYEKYGIPKVDVDNLEAAYVEFGGYEFGLEGDQYAEMNIKKRSRKKRRNGKRSIFRKGKRRGNAITEEDLDDIVSRNAGALGDGTSEGYDIDEQEIDDFVSTLDNGWDIYEGSEQNELPPQSSEPENNVQEPVVNTEPQVEGFDPEIQDIQEGMDNFNGANSEWFVDDEQLNEGVNPIAEGTVTEGPVTQEPSQNLNGVDNEFAANLNQVFAAWPVTAGVDDVERQQFIQDILSLDNENRNHVLTSISSGQVNNIDELRNLISGQELTNGQTFGV